jgi:hypothetical protein
VALPSQRSRCQTEAAACAAAIIMMILVRPSLSQQSESDSDIPWRPQAATVRGAVSESVNGIRVCRRQSR